MSYSFFQSQFPKFRPFAPFWARFQLRGKQKAGNNVRAVKTILVPNFGGRPPNPQTERKKHQSPPCYPIGTDLGTKQTRRKGREGIEDWKFVWPPKREREKQKEDPFFIFFYLLFLRLIQSQSLFIPRYLFVVVEKFSIFEVWYLPKNMFHRSINTFDLIVDSNMGTSLPLLLLLSSLSALSLLPSTTEARFETQTHNHFPNKQ